VKFGLKVAVLAFEDGTEDFTKRGSPFGGYEFNLARTGINGLAIGSGAAYEVSPMPPVFWARALAEDLSASGEFASARLVFSRSEIAGDDILVEGVLKHASMNNKPKQEPDRFSLHLRFSRLPDHALLWEGDVGRAVIRPQNLTRGCIAGSCAIDRINGYLNDVMRAVFSDARAALGSVLSQQAAPPQNLQGGEPTEELIKRLIGND
jgi:hypothetical protein